MHAFGITRNYLSIAKLYVCGYLAVVSLYLRDGVLLGEDASTAVYHSFIMACFTAPVIGAVIADACLAPFTAILLFTVIVAAGHGLITAAAVPSLPIDISYVSQLKWNQFICLKCIKSMWLIKSLCTSAIILIITYLHFAALGRYVD